MSAHPKRAWARLFTEHGPVLRGFFVRRGANEDAEDLVQETYLRLLRAHQQPGQTIANPEAYLYTVAVNLAREQAARRKQAPLRIEDMEQFAQRLVAVDDVEDSAQRQQRQQRLQTVLAGLPERVRAVLVMQYRDGLSYRQIAERLGVSSHMVKKYVVRGLSACRSALADEGAQWW
ncbi:RNA polymerase sigma70 [Xanthomonas phaseoli pv. phaseoli]|uniref:RNA polymerase sigma70 n=1 Tax=Xanthomonas campestris pv. phaseoli TaxID=317013 RepID=A0AB34QLB4_XANCH|nr:MULTISPECIES: RNA polymerase sigma factor [Xanthomonas]ATS23990.1 RNA polymerase sigma factor [Xanthomonas phaseoli pv. phaseoli]ATS28208.1 RNA polymerase sigma factor [Xanthomonas phaseoli pv. phaseoli]ATS32256.1 RNA polymerase sigma factor [Xanthomonas phaseoli pv. phaseoli]ATS36396.1 RNA polymerase sigma factor [Xanthomonas phaseoli pv. phaseoli]AZU15086.1 RNA polymerase sigma70 [Xanthomonas phaseoli pv. phaseoli]